MFLLGRVRMKSMIFAKKKSSEETGGDKMEEGLQLFYVFMEGQ